MHQKLGKDGLAVISVALDPLDGEITPLPELKASIDGFLKKQKATFTNLVLDEKDDFWQKKFGIDGPPSVFVFDRTGKWTQFRPGEMDANPHAVEQLVVELLKK